MSIWTFFTERGPGIAVWLVALAAQMSGFTSTAIALALIGLAVFFLIAPACHHIRAWHGRRMAAGQKTLSLPQIFLLTGLAGTWLFMTIGLGAAAWMIINGSPFAAPDQAKNDGPLTWFGNISMEGGPLQNRNVFSLTFPGANVSQDEVQIKSANLTSAVNGTKLELEIIAENEIVPIDQIGLIPPGAAIRLVAKFGPAAESGKVSGLEPKGLP